MMNKKLKLAALSIIALPSLLSAGASTFVGGVFTADGTGARPLGMGGAFVAIADDANATYVNPAGMAYFRPDQRAATFTHTNLFEIPGLNREFVAYGQGNGSSFGALGLSWNRMSLDFEGVNWAEDMITYSGAAMLTKGDEYPSYSLGWNLKYMRVDSGLNDALDGSSVGNGRASGYGVDLGVMAKFRKSLAIGIMVQDIYSALNWDTGTLEVMPTSGRAGFAYKFTDRTQFATEARGTQTSGGFEFASWHAGAEHWFFDGKKEKWGAVKNIGLRGGGTQTLKNDDSGILSAGASVVADRWQLD